MEKLSKFVTWPLVALLLGGAAAFVAIVVLAPPETQVLLFGANGLVMSIVAYVMRSPRDRRALDPGLLPGARPRPWEVEGYDDEDPTSPQGPRALERRDRPPGDSARPRSRRDGYASPDLLVAVLTAACGGLALLTGIAIAGALLSGCDGPPGPARRAVEVATVVLLDADRDAAVRYTAAAEVALERSTTLAEYRAAMAPHDALEQALRVSQSAILAADASLDAWREGGAERWPSLAACVVMALADLRNALAAAGVHAPPELDAVITTARSFALSACPGGA